MTAKKILPEKLTSASKPEGREGSASISREKILGRGKRKCKGWEVGEDLAFTRVGDGETGAE